MLHKNCGSIASKVDVKQKIANSRAIDRATGAVGVSTGDSEANKTERNYDAVNQANRLSVGIIGTIEICRVALQDANMDWTTEGLGAAKEQDDNISLILI